MINPVKYRRFEFFSAQRSKLSWDDTEKSLFPAYELESGPNHPNTASTQRYHSYRVINTFKIGYRKVGAVVLDTEADNYQRAQKVFKGFSEERQLLRLPQEACRLFFFAAQFPFSQSMTWALWTSS